LQIGNDADDIEVRPPGTEHHIEGVLHPERMDLPAARDDQARAGREISTDQTSHPAADTVCPPDVLRNDLTRTRENQFLRHVQ
jgi:hypothetical protein